MDRVRLLDIFPPVFLWVTADHVTLRFGVPQDTAPPPPVAAAVIGIIERDGVQALVVEIDGEIRRPDGSIYHMTWSYDRDGGRRPVDSNRVLATYSFDAVERRPIRLLPRVFGLPGSEPVPNKSR